MILKIDELYEISIIVLQYIKSLGYDRIESGGCGDFYHDIHYWMMDLENRPEVGLGDFNFDIELIYSVFTDNEEGEDFFAMDYHFRYLGRMLITFGGRLAIGIYDNSKGNNHMEISIIDLVEVVRRLTHSLKEGDLQNEFYDALEFGESAWYQKIEAKNVDFVDFMADHPITDCFIEDDIEALKRLLDKNEQPCIYDIERLGGVFLVLSGYDHERIILSKVEDI